MREQIGDCFVEAGYQKLLTNKPEFTIYYEERSNTVNAIHICDLTGNYELLPETFAHIKEKVTWRFRDMGIWDIHVMSVILTDDVSYAKNLIKTEEFAWIVDVAAKQLLIYEDKAEDFYGIKRLIEKVLEETVFTQEIKEGSEMGGYVRQQVTEHRGKSKYIVNVMLVVFNLLLFLICTSTGEVLYNIGILKPLEVVYNGQWYRMITAMFLHADVEHITGNMILLFFLGEVVERHIGHVKYFILYMVSGMAGSALSLAYSLWQQDFIGSLGASGAVYGIIGGLLWILVRNRGNIEGITLTRVLFVIGYSLYIGFTSTNIDNMAHIGGLVAGFLLGILLYRKKRGIAKDES